MTSTGADISNAKLDDAGLILSDVLRDYMQIMGVVNGLKGLGFSSEDVPDLVTGTLPQVMLFQKSICVHLSPQIFVIIHSFLHRSPRFKHQSTANLM